VRQQRPKPEDFGNRDRWHRHFCRCRNSRRPGVHRRESGFASGVTTIGGTTQSALAQLLTPPQKPSGASWMWYILPFIFPIGMLMAPIKKTWIVPALVGGTIAVVGAALKSIPLEMVGVWGAILVTIIAYESALHETSRTELPEKLRIWNQQINRWSRLYYCYRDDLVYDPETGRSCPPGQMNTLLYP